MTHQVLCYYTRRTQKNDKSGKMTSRNISGTNNTSAGADVFSNLTRCTSFQAKNTYVWSGFSSKLIKSNREMYNNRNNIMIHAFFIA